MSRVPSGNGTRRQLGQELERQAARAREQRAWEQRGKQCPIQRVDWWR